MIHILADGTPHNPGPDFGKAAPSGLLIIVLLLLAVVFLVRSMNRQLKKVPKSFEAETRGSDQAVGDAGGAPVDTAAQDNSAPGDGPGNEHS